MRERVVSYLFANQVISALLFLGGIWLVIQIRDVLVALFVSYILMAAIAPYVDFLRKNRIPKLLAIIVPYIVAIVVLALILMTLLPFFISQISLLFRTFPSYLNQDVNIFGSTLNGIHLNSIISKELENIGSNAFAVTTFVFGGVISAISILAISFYLLLYRDSLKKGFTSMFPQVYQGKIEKVVNQAEDKLGSWLRGQIVLSFFIGLMTWVILTILGVEFALPLAVLAGILEIVPTIGPIISAIPAIIVALSASPVLAGVVAASYLVIQLIENNILVPRIMQRAVGLNPIAIILGIIIGGKLLGISGALLAIPFISLLVVAYKNLE